MATISSNVSFDSNLMNLKGISIDAIRPEIYDLIIDGENIEMAFSTVRDQVVFTNKRIFVVNVQGITGKKVMYLSYPYSKIQYYGVQTAGMLDIDCELILGFSNGSHLQLDFRSNVDIKKINNMISHYIL